MQSRSHDPGPRQAGRSRRAGPVAAALVAATLLVAACGGDEPKTPSVAGDDSSKPAQDGGSAGGGKRADALAYARCMRSHGVQSFPDPNSEGEIALNATPENGLDFNNPRMKAAMEACKELEPVLSEGDRETQHAGALKFAKCMRENGLPDFPDPPPPDSGPETQGSDSGQPQGDDVDPESPAYKRAMQACRDLVPSGAESGLSSGP
jgi:hypothetical protein